MLTIGKSGRIYALQGNQSLDHTEKIQKEFFFDLHRNLKEKEFIMECVTGKNILESFKKTSEEELLSHLDRMVILYIVPDTFINFDIDIVFFEDTILLISIPEKQVISIQSRSTAKAFHALFGLATSIAQKLDLNAYIRELIEAKS